MDTKPELNFRSFLADAMRDYLDYLDHLGFCIVSQASLSQPHRPLSG